MTETKESLAAERDQLRRDNEALTRQVNELRASASTPVEGRRPATPPSFGLSEGERQDLAVRGVITSPWTGQQLLADEQGVATSTADAQAAIDRARARRDQGE